MQWDSWYQGKIFTTDWTSSHFQTWTQVLAPFREQRVSILEVGSWEGRATIFFLEYLPFSVLTCVDTFKQDGQETRFDANLTAYAGRVRKIKSRSIPALDALLAEKNEFDIIYIDGSHRRDDVLIDSILAWQVLKTDGILIWDDYLWQPQQPVSQRPQQAIDVFLELHGDDCTKRLVGEQVIVQKTDTPSSVIASTYLPTIQKPLARTLRNLIKFLRKEVIIK